jgi:hypothetical protein
MERVLRALIGAGMILTVWHFRGPLMLVAGWAALGFLLGMLAFAAFSRPRPDPEALAVDEFLARLRREME